MTMQHLRPCLRSSALGGRSRRRQQPMAPMAVGTLQLFLVQAPFGRPPGWLDCNRSVLPMF